MFGESEKIGVISGSSNHQKEFAILAELCGIHADPAVYRIIIELLEMQIEPDAIYKLLRSIRRSKSSAKGTEKPVKK